jgi:hypothetical protein
MRGWVCCIQLLLALTSAVILVSKSSGTHDHISLSQIQDSPSWRARSPYLYPAGRGWPSHTPRYWVLFSSPPTTRRAMMEEFKPTSCFQDNSSARTMQKTQLLYCCRGMFTTLLHSNSCGADHIENTVLLLLHACMLQALPSNSHYLQSHCLATGLYATIF